MRRKTRRLSNRQLEESMKVKRMWVRAAVALGIAGSATFGAVRLMHSGAALAKAPEALVTSCSQLQGQTGTFAVSPVLVSAGNPTGVIEISSYQWGIGRGISSPTGGTADRESSPPSVSEIVVTKSTDASTPILFGQSVALKPAGMPWMICTFQSSSTGGTSYLQLNFDNALVSSFSMSSGGDRPQESITLNFTKVTMNYQGQNPQSFQRNSQQGRPPFDFQTVHLGP
jgi:type VI secretion system secreted protein Hcp